jgi:hypothetical protein
MKNPICIVAFINVLSKAIKSKVIISKALYNYCCCVTYMGLLSASLCFIINSQRKRFYSSSPRMWRGEGLVAKRGVNDVFLSLIITSSSGDGK